MSEWSCPVLPPPLGRQEAHVWLAPLDLPPALIGAGRQLLSARELGRADRYVPDRSRRGLVASHAALRVLLGRYLGEAPAALAFREGEFGKPELAGDSDLQFNISHADPWALIGVTLGSRIGVDIERRRPISNMDELAKLCFSARELAAYSAFRDNEREIAFFNAWTRKEAFIKAIGRGLTYPLADFDVTLAPDEPARLLRVEHELAPARWRLWSLDSVPGFAGAAIIDEPDAALSCFRFDADLIDGAVGS